MQYEIKGTPMPVLICKMEGGESINCQKGAMEPLIKSFLDALSDGFSSVGNDAFGLISASLCPDDSQYADEYKHRKRYGRFPRRSRKGSY